MNIQFALPLAILLFIMCSCSSNEHKTMYENGAVKEVFTTNDGTNKQGKYTKYDESGALIEEALYDNNELHGERKLFFQNGNVEVLETYVQGEMDGPHKVFRENGKLLLSTNYTDGDLVGVITKYFETGSISEEVTIEDGEENGPFKEYYENGQVQWEGNYLNGDNEFGLLKQFDESGELIKKMMCDSLAVCQTIWTKEKGDIVPEKIKLSAQ